MLIIHLCAVGDKLWWADQGTDQIGICDKTDGGNWKVLRNSTSPMMHMKIYNETVQTGAEFTAVYLLLVVVVMFLFCSSAFFVVVELLGKKMGRRCFT